MATIGEVFKSMFGIDTNAELTTTGEQVTPPNDNQQQQQTQQVQQQTQQLQQQTQQVQQEQNNTSPANSSDAEKLQQMQKEIDTLKAANLALLKQTPIQQEELSIEDMIFRAVVGLPRKENM